MCSASIHRFLVHARPPHTPRCRVTPVNAVSYYQHLPDTNDAGQMDRLDKEEEAARLAREKQLRSSQRLQVTADRRSGLGCCSLVLPLSLSACCYSGAVGGSSTSVLVEKLAHGRVNMVVFLSCLVAVNV